MALVDAFAPDCSNHGCLIRRALCNWGEA